jgi:hypothetical protein
MIRKKSKQQRNNKCIAIIAGVVILTIIISTIVINHKTPIQRKLIGFWNIEVTNSAWDRDSIYDISTIIHIETKDTIILPSLCCDKPVRIAKAEATGIWKIISTNPDSVFFNVPKNPLHGKYAIRFFIDKNGYQNEYFNFNMPNNIYKIELKNDSTLLICNKGGVIAQSEVRNWEGKN